MAMWELAPGSPWNAIFMLLWSWWPCISRSQSICQYPAGGFEVGRGVDAARHGVDDGDVDPHAGLQRPKLLELLLLLQRRGRQRGRSAPAPRGDRHRGRCDGSAARRRQGAVARVKYSARSRRGPIGEPTAFTTFGLVVFLLGVDLGGQRRDIDRGIVQRRQHVADIVGRNGREIALQIDHDLGLALGIELSPAPRRSGPSRTGDRVRVITASPPWDLTAAAISGVSVATATRPICAASARRSTWTIIGRPAMSSSGLPGRRVAAMRAGISTKVRVSVIGERGQRRLENRPEIMGIGGKSGRLYGLPEHGQTDISTLLRVRRESLIPEAHSAAVLPASVDLPAWSLIQNGLLRTQQNPRCHSRHLPRAAGDELYRRRDFLAQDAGKAGLRDCREGRGPEGGGQEARGAVRADREAAADRLGREGRGRRQEVRRLPHLREGRPQPRRPESLRHRRRPQGRGPRASTSPRP